MFGAGLRQHYFDFEAHQRLLQTIISSSRSSAGTLTTLKEAKMLPYWMVCGINASTNIKICWTQSYSAENNIPFYNAFCNFINFVARELLLFKLATSMLHCVGGSV
jgi:hypothetical protein